MSVSISTTVSTVNHAFEALPVLEYAACSLISFNAIQDRGLTDCYAREFWQAVTTALLGDALINWCHLFGTEINNRYWQQITYEESDFRLRIYDVTGFDYQQLRHYRQSICEQGRLYRDGAFDIAVIQKKLDLGPAEQVLETCFDWCREICTELGVDQGEDSILAKKNYFEELRAQVQTVMDYNLQFNVT